MDGIIGIIFSTGFLFSMLRISTPLVFAALAGLITKKAGITNLAIEGTMLIGALTGVVVSALTKSALVGVIAAVAVGLAVSYVLAFFSLTMKTDMYLASLAMNMFASGGTVFALFLISGDKGNSTNLVSMTLPALQIPLLKDIPVLGQILSGHNLFTYLAILSVFGVNVFMYRTRLGLRIRSVGENEHLAESVGLSVYRIRMVSLLVSGVFASLAGVYLSMGYVKWFARDMSAGRGFIGISAMNLGNVTPLGSFFASLLFGFAESLTNQLQALNVPVEFIQMTPYLIAIVSLVIFSVMRDKRESRVTKN